VPIREVCEQALVEGRKAVPLEQVQQADVGEERLELRMAADVGNAEGLQLGLQGRQVPVTGLSGAPALVGIDPDPGPDHASIGRYPRHLNRLQVVESAGPRRRGYLQGIEPGRGDGISGRVLDLFRRERRFLGPTKEGLLQALFVTYEWIIDAAALAGRHQRGPEPLLFLGRFLAPDLFDLVRRGLAPVSLVVVTQVPGGLMQREL
jgi:hypothetical protein